MEYTGSTEVGLSRLKLFEHFYNLTHNKRLVKVIAIYYINIDYLSIINNSFGYACGDLIIRETSKRLDSLKDRDTFVTHLFSDEFLVMKILPDESSVRESSEEILSLIQKPVAVENELIYISASIGISTFPKHGKDTNSLLSKARTALSYSKERGKNHYHIFNELEDEDLDYKIKERYNIIRNLKTAVSENEFNILYQPIVSVDGDRIIGAEALLRWNSRKMGSVPPGLFIPIAEESSEIIPIGEWVLTNALEQYSKWCEKGFEDFRISINLSACQLHDSNLINRMESLKAVYPFNPGNIELEITESAMIKDFETTARVLKKLHELGIKISIDDFGVGYCSLNYISNLVIDKMKIDKSYIDEITCVYKKRLIVKAIIDLAHKMGVEVTAEGVENLKQLQLLKRFKCDRYQGFIFSRPLTANDFERLLECQCR